ncbi:MAG: NAD(P)/FAD-dependent oxidoreductase [Rhizobiales bacterium]|nr:NAD(P)/FAD-dependent oxidoreductase [Hyphomicrobiales bacterium]
MSGTAAASAGAPRVVIVGAGFGGIACAKALGRAEPAVTVIDRRNYHLFVPLLYQVATAALSPADIARPIRGMLSRHRNITVMLGEVTGIDPARRLVHVREAPDLAYDRLILAPGSSYNYFGHDDWAENAPGPRSISDARRIRDRLLLAFERAEIATDPAEQARLLTTIVVGGGPTGVEMAGSVAELARHTLVRDFRRIDPSKARVVLVEGGPRLLSTFPEPLSDYTRRTLERLGVTVMTGSKVEAVEAHAVTIDGVRHAAGCVIWGAGVRASPLAALPGLPVDPAGRVGVGPDLAVPGLDGVYVIGDSAATPGPDGRPLPALAQVAHQQGGHLGRALRRNLADGTPVPPFRFHDRGNTAIVGRNAAVFDFGRFRLKGRIGWVLWALVHIYLLTGFENRALVAVRWFWMYLTYQRGARLITGGDDGREP